MSFQQRKDYIYGNLKQRGLSDVQASAVLGNLIQENSTLMPRVTNSSSGALGIHQVLGARKKDLLASYDDPYNFHNQVDFLLAEIFEPSKHPNSWRGTSNFKKFLEISDLQEATYFFRKEFERPGEHEAHDNTRLNYATQAFNHYTGQEYEPGSFAPTSTYSSAPQQVTQHTYVPSPSFDTSSAPNMTTTYTPPPTEEEEKEQYSQAQQELIQRNAERAMLLAAVPQTGIIEAPTRRQMQLGGTVASTTANMGMAINAEMDRYRTELWNETDRLENEGMTREDALQVATRTVTPPPFITNPKTALRGQESERVTASELQSADVILPDEQPVLSGQQSERVTASELQSAGIRLPDIFADIPSTLTGISPFEEVAGEEATVTEDEVLLEEEGLEDEIGLYPVDQETPLVFARNTSSPVIGQRRERENIIGPREEFDTDGYAIVLPSTVGTARSKHYTPFINTRPREFIVGSDVFDRERELWDERAQRVRERADEIMSENPSLTYEEALMQTRREIPEAENAFGELGERCIETANGHCLSSALNYEGSYLAPILGVAPIRDDMDSIMDKFNEYSIKSRSNSNTDYAHNNSVDAWEFHLFLQAEMGYKKVEVPEDEESRRRVLHSLPIGTILGSGDSSEYYTTGHDDERPRHAVQIVGYTDDGTPLINNMGTVESIDRYFGTYNSISIPPQYEKYDFEYITEGMDRELGLEGTVEIDTRNADIDKGVAEVTKDLARATGVPTVFIEKLAKPLVGLLEQESESGTNIKKQAFDNTFGNEYVKPAVKKVKDRLTRAGNRLRSKLGEEDTQQQLYKLEVEAYRKYPEDEVKMKQHYNKLLRERRRQLRRTESDERLEESSYGVFSIKDVSPLMEELTGLTKEELQSGAFTNNSTSQGIQDGAKMAIIKLTETAAALRQKYPDLTDEQLINLTYVGYSNFGKIMDEKDFVDPYIREEKLKDSVLEKIKEYTKNARDIVPTNRTVPPHRTNQTGTMTQRGTANIPLIGRPGNQPNIPGTLLGR